jgi:hypothetical protein
MWRIKNPSIRHKIRNDKVEPVREGPKDTPGCLKPSVKKEIEFLLRKY